MVITFYHVSDWPLFLYLLTQCRGAHDSMTSKIQNGTTAHSMSPVSDCGNHRNSLSMCVYLISVCVVEVAPRCTLTLSPFRTLSLLVYANMGGRESVIASQGAAAQFTTKRHKHIPIIMYVKNYMNSLFHIISTLLFSHSIEMWIM